MFFNLPTFFPPGLAFFTIAEAPPRTFSAVAAISLALPRLWWDRGSEIV